MSKKGISSYIKAFIYSAIALILILNSLVAAYTVLYQDKIKTSKISELSYGPVKIVGSVRGTTYGQVNFSTVNLNDGTDTVTIFFGKYKNIEDPRKVRRRDNLPVHSMSKKDAIKKLNRPVHYNNLEIIGIYYPYVSIVHAYYINGKITVVEYLIIMIVLVLAAFFFYAAAESIQSITSKKNPNPYLQDNY
jgi:hypothetical protein